jgi:alkylation response protein AidB-like acyl-CoA dehydrogenase
MTLHPVHLLRKALMDLDLSEDQQALHDTVQDLFEKESPTTAVRAAEPGGFDPDLWRTVVEMGLASIAASEASGGGGAGISELAVVAEDVGRYLAPIPFIEASVATTVLADLPGSDALAAIVRRVVDGEALATIALHPVRDGVARTVPAGAIADVVLARRDDQLVVVDAPAPADATLPNLGSMPIAHRPVGEDAVVVAEGDEAIALHQHAVRLWQQLTGVALVGLGRRALEIAVDYVQERKAFGVIIANFQTIQHHLSDDVALLEGARLLAYEAAWAQDTGQDDADELALMAFLYAWEAGLKTASDSLHFHGGYGFSLEYDIQLFLRRAKAWPLVCGDPAGLYAELGRGFAATKGA